MPDICSPTNGFICVSDQGRAALEELAPGCIAYFPLNMRAPESMQPANAYWFIEVISRAQVIDWDRTETVPRVVRAPDGRESRTISGGVFGKSVKFKGATPDLPPLWREIDVNRPTVQFFVAKNTIFLWDDLWEELDARFPGQLNPRKLAGG